MSGRERRRWKGEERLEVAQTERLARWMFECVYVVSRCYGSRSIEEGEAGGGARACQVPLPARPLPLGAAYWRAQAATRRARSPHPRAPCWGPNGPKCPVRFVSLLVGITPSSFRTTPIHPRISSARHGTRELQKRGQVARPRDPPALSLFAGCPSSRVRLTSWLPSVRRGRGLMGKV